MSLCGHNFCYLSRIQTLQWRHNGRDSVSNHHPNDCFLNRLFRLRSKDISKLRVTGLCAGNSPEAGEFPAQTASNAENVSIWWRHHDFKRSMIYPYYVWVGEIKGRSRISTKISPRNIEFFILWPSRIGHVWERHINSCLAICYYE